MSEKSVEDQVAEQDVTAAEAPADNVRPMDRAKKIDRAKKKVVAAVGDAREKIQHAGERFQQASQEEFRARRQRGREIYQEKIEHHVARAREEAAYKLDDVNDFVRHKPGTSILIAAGAGFLLGLLFRPRRYND